MEYKPIFFIVFFMATAWDNKTEFLVKCIQKIFYRSEFWWNYMVNIQFESLNIRVATSKLLSLKWFLKLSNSN